MKSILAISASAYVGVAYAASLGAVCTKPYVKSILPTSDSINSLLIDTSSITTNAVYNASIPENVFFPATTIDYCNVTLAYSHPGKNDRVLLEFWMPSPDKFQNRWLSTGGGGYAINSGEQFLPGGVQYGAASGITDGGFGGFSTQVDAAILFANGTIDYDTLYMFGYKAHHELTTIGKALAKAFYDTEDKLYAYYQGCSEGGREGYSQVQRFGDDWDGAVIAAPALRYGHQQVNHLYPGVVEKTLNYFPPPCELEKIVNMTIDACDALDGKVDGVVARTDLCKLHFNINSTIGTQYSCAASSGSSASGGTTPAQNGTISKKGVAVADKILDGLHTIDGRRAYIWYQPTATFDDAIPQYNSETGEWELAITSLGGEWVTRFLQYLDLDNLPDLEGITYNSLVDWMQQGWQRYEDVLQTTWPDLTPFQSAGGKIIHIHGESDPSIPAGSSVHYHESVRKVMYPELSFEKSTKALNEWNRLFLIPGAAHCQPSTNQPNGGWPQTTLPTLIEWVEGGSMPERLNATVLSGEKKGEEQKLCAWPLRPLWKKGSQEMECVFDQKSFDTWVYDFDAFKLPVY
ncbi:tannase and feruloyl esterase [Aspergillus cavernicola]|uniref:Carboxylic ester hydrolase n=1 Tax=Aspergillus cavernicola TaxID=176166 RepID=A0ABR4HKK2_9EURO